MTILKVIAFVIFAISCVVIYHNTNSYETNKRIIYIIVGNIVMYIITEVVCNIAIGGMAVKNAEALNDTLTVMKLIFTPINSIIVLATLGNTLGKLKDKLIGMDKAGTRVIIMLVIFIILLVIETSYVSGLVQNLLV